MKRKLISSLSTFISENRSEKVIDAVEEIIVDSIDKIAKEETFYELPTDTILRIIGKGKIEDIELLCEVVSMMCENKGDESIQLLKVINPKKATFEECIKVLSSFIRCPICKRTGELFQEYKEMHEIKYENQISEIQKVINKLQSTAVEKQANSQSAPKKSSDIESNLIKAANEGKLTTIQYLVEKCHADVETKDEKGHTPLNIASIKGHLDIVKYLYEKCHAIIQTENENGYTPINNASINGHLGIVKYLHEHCYVDIETKDKYRNTPINYASWNGHFDVVKYLYETCYAKVSTEAIEYARTEEIKEYLRSKQRSGLAF